MSRARRQDSSRAVEALYSWHISDEDLSDIEQQFLIEQNMKGVDLDYFKELLHKVPAHLDEIDEQITQKIDRSFDELDPVECTVLRMAVYELMHRPDIPYRVVINEAIELTKIFGGEGGFKYVNGIVDKLSQSLRKVEIDAAKRPKK